MSKQGKKKLSKKAIGLASGGLAVLVFGGYLAFGRGGASPTEMMMAYQVAPVTEGSIASSTLLTGTVKALSEQKVYYDNAKGDIATIHVNVGDKVKVGQALLQYSTKSAQAAYDQAVRARDKVGRQIYDLRTYGLPATETIGEDGSVTSNVAEVQRNVNSQMADLNDAYASAQVDVEKAQEALNQLLVTSTVEGTVVEVTRSIDPSKTAGQVVIHIVSEGQLQVEGSLTEYDLANMSLDQEVKLTSKVFPDKSWPGKISYISNYPSEAGASTAGSGSSTGANYPFKVDFTGDIAGLRQGFKINIEVINKSVSKLVPTSALVQEGDKSYVWVYDKDKMTLNKVEVTLGRADAFNQEVTSGLENNQSVISNPGFDFKDGQKLKPEEVVDAADMQGEVPSDK